MRIGRILDPELLPKFDMEAEIAAILKEVQEVQWRRADRFESKDDRVFMDVTGMGLEIYRYFRHRYPELADRIIPVKGTSGY